ncbi:MAG: thiamine pyrophosphate-dependent enzyme, partial [Treponema sp.]|uniref:thiamine pyrophosphate-dependent enzyme n=1 Tax=Treponema sp. TaxID=166 RepID=UPI00298D6053
ESLKKIQFIHVDIDNNELTDSKIPNKLNVLGSMQDFIEKSKDINFDTKKDWLEYCKDISNRYSQKVDVERFEKVPQPYDAIKSIRSIVKEDAVFISDIGQNQVWTSQMLSMKGNDRFYSSGGLAPMGFAIPCAVGAAFANSNKKIVCLTGDGGFHFALQSLMLIRQYNLNVVIYVLNNASLGMITQFQTLYFDSNMAGTTAEGGYLVPEIDKIALAYGMNYKLIEDVQKLDEYTTERNTICEVKLPKLTTVVPKLEFNKELYDMIPYLPENEIEEIRK